MSAAYLKGPKAQRIINVPHWCEGKHRFESGMTAAQVAALSRYPMDIYRCGLCGGFHIGSAISDHKTGSTKIARELIR